MVGNTESLVPQRQTIFLVDKAGFNLFTTILFKKDTKSFPLIQVKYDYIFEYIFCFSKGEPRVYNPIHIEDIWEGLTRFQEDVLSVISSNGNLNFDRKDPVFNHPAKTPIWLTRDLILTFTNMGDTVLDPFAGVGTTVYEAERLNRVGIGIEINEKYVK